MVSKEQVSLEKIKQWQFKILNLNTDLLGTVVNLVDMVASCAKGQGYFPLEAMCLAQHIHLPTSFVEWMDFSFFHGPYSGNILFFKKKIIRTGKGLGLSKRLTDFKFNITFIYLWDCLWIYCTCKIYQSWNYIKQSIFKFVIWLALC